MKEHTHYTIIHMPNGILMPIPTTSEVSDEEYDKIDKIDGYVGLVIIGLIIGTVLFFTLRKLFYCIKYRQKPPLSLLVIVVITLALGLLVLL